MYSTNITDEEWIILEWVILASFICLVLSRELHGGDIQDYDCAKIY